MKRSMGPLLRAAEAMELPPQLIPKVSRIVLQANTALTVENHGGVVSFSDTCIVIDTAVDPLVVSGKGLSIKRMDKEAIELSGRIDAVAYRGNG